MATNASEKNIIKYSVAQITLLALYMKSRHRMLIGTFGFKLLDTH